MRFHYGGYILRALLLAQDGCGACDSAQGSGARALVAGVHIAFVIITDIDKILIESLDIEKNIEEIEKKVDEITS